MVNVILLLVNLIALLVALGERSSSLGDGMQWLYATDIAQIAPAFWAVTQGESVSSVAVLTIWLILSGAWAAASVVDFILRSRRSTGATSEAGYPERSDEPRIGASGPSDLESPKPVIAKAPGASGSGVGLAAGGAAVGFAGAMASAQSAQMGNQGHAHGLDAAALSDPSLGPLLSDLEKEVSSLPAEAQQEIDQLRRALEALVAKP
jgi:hypothetical protein